MKKTLENILSIKIGAEAGQGVKSAGLMLAKLASRSGYNIYNHVEFPSLIRGGHNVIQTNISKGAISAPRKLNDLIVALNQETINLHKDEFKEGAGILFDSEKNINTSGLSKNVKLFGVPLAKISAESFGSDSPIKKDQLVNMAALGAVISLFSGNMEILNSLIEEEFKNKGTDVVEVNKKAAKTGYEYVENNYKADIRTDLTPVDSLSSALPTMVLNGNEAVALGAISSGLQYASIYPMSPASNILHVLAENQEKYMFTYKQPEDEISAINMAIGASFAGARSMTSTSGGGFCLMTEGYGLAGMTETPLVIVDGMRPGPATGMPTWSEQGDLQMVLNAHQGDFPRILLAAGDAKESFDLTRKAFELADKYQTPVVLLIDKNICENEQSFPFFTTDTYKIDRAGLITKEKEDYKRFEITENGISERSIPGVGNFFIANSDEHNEEGYSTEDSAVRNAMVEKRMRKLTTCEKEDMEAPVIYGPEDAPISIISWGSSKGSILEALKNTKNVNFLDVAWMNPFPAEQLEKMVEKSKYVVVIECNYSGQLERLIKEKTNILVNYSIRNYDGRPIYPEEILEKLNSIDFNGNARVNLKE